jgi:hypothetical protein
MKVVDLKYIYVRVINKNFVGRAMFQKVEFELHVKYWTSVKKSQILPVLKTQKLSRDETAGQTRRPLRDLFMFLKPVDGRTDI